MQLLKKLTIKPCVPRSVISKSPAVTKDSFQRGQMRKNRLDKQKPRKSPPRHYVVIPSLSTVCPATWKHGKVREFESGQGKVREMCVVCGMLRQVV